MIERRLPAQLIVLTPAPVIVAWSGLSVGGAALFVLLLLRLLLPLLRVMIRRAFRVTDTISMPARQRLMMAAH